MCTGQFYRITDLYNFDNDKGDWKHTFYSDKNHSINDLKRHPRYQVEQIPCGHCWECKTKKAQEWAFRCMKEASKYEHNVMLTLTYDDEHLPKCEYIDKTTGELCQDVTLCKRDHQLFMKRLRKAYPEYEIRFILSGEYGETYGRPHYHVILFNLKVDDMKPYKMSVCEWSKQQNPLYKSKKIDKIWGKGFVDLNEVNYETCCYVARYTTKKLYGDIAEAEYTSKGKEPPYICMSRRPGIGYEFYEENKDKFMQDKKFYQKTKKGLREIKPGRYFDKLIEKEAPEVLEELKELRKAKGREYWDEIMNKTDIQKHEYINNKEYTNQKKSRFLKRGL